MIRICAVCESTYSNVCSKCAEDAVLSLEDRIRAKAGAMTLEEQLELTKAMVALRRAVGLPPVMVGPSGRGDTMMTKIKGLFSRKQPAVESPPSRKPEPCKCGRTQLAGYNGMCWMSMVVDERGMQHTRAACTEEVTR